MQEHAIVVHSPACPSMVGQVVKGAKSAELLRTRGAVVLPFDPQLDGPNPVGGYYQRDYGPNGPVIDATRPQRSCPMLQYVTGNGRIYYAVGIEPVRPDEPIHGSLRLTVDSRVAGSVSGCAIVGAKPLVLDRRGPVVLCGTVGLSCAMPGYLALALWGVARNAKATFVACTHTLG